MIKEIRELINQNEDVKKALQQCSDDFILQNQSIILAALDTENIRSGYKIKILINDDVVEWEYIPESQDAKFIEEIHKVSSQYKYKLPTDWEKFYLIDLNNDINWTENKRHFAKKCKEILTAIDKGEPVKGFWLTGTSNSGKSYGTIALLNMIASKGKSVAFVNIGNLISETQDSFSDFGKNANFAMEQVKKSDVIVIDDLGSERPTPWFKENVLLPIIDYRVKANKTTIFTSNSNISKYGNQLKYRSQNPEVEVVTNDKIITRINDLISEEVNIN